MAWPYYNDVDPVGSCHGMTLQKQNRNSYLYESICTLFTDLPDGSFRFLNDASQAIASGVLQATDGTDGTHNAAESEGKCSVKIHL